MISFRSKATRKILDYFFLNPQERQYGTALAHAVHEDPKNIHRKLLELEKEGILASEFSGKQRYFWLSKKYPLLNEVKKLFLTTAGLEKELSGALLSTEGISEAYLFGSYARGSMNTQSDIDLLVIGDHSEIALQKKLNVFQRNIGREINVISMTTEEFSRKKKEKNPLIKDIFRNTIKRVL